MHIFNIGNGRRKILENLYLKNKGDIKSVTVRHPTSVTKLSKPISNQKLFFKNQTK